MSIRYMTAVWSMPLPPSEKLVLLKLADCANDEGCNAYPSVATLAQSATLSERQVQRVLRVLHAEHRLIAIDKPATRYRPTIYRITLPKSAVTSTSPLTTEAVVSFEISAHPDATGDSLSPLPTAPRGDNPSPLRGDIGAARGDMGDGSGVTPMSPDPSKRSVQEEPVRTAGSAAPPRRALLAAYHDAFHERFGQPPHIDGGKDGARLKRLATEFGAAKVLALLDWFFRTADPFIRSSGYTVGVFYACFNKLLVTYRPPVESRAAANSQLQAMRDRADQRRRMLTADAERAVAALDATTRAALTRVAKADIQAVHPEVVRWMKPEAFEQAVQGTLIALIVQQCGATRTVAEVIESFASRSTAA